MAGFWLAGMNDDASSRIEEAKNASAAANVRNTDIRELQHQVERLSLLNQAMWELLRERLNLTDADLEAKAREVDLRDGVEDGKMTAHAVRCPSCSRISSSRHHKCIYCCQLFEKPLFG
jgi:t-SNARE complex subunit (syntaxin)